MVMPTPRSVLSRLVPALFPTTPEGASSGAELVTPDGRQLPLVASTLRGRAHGGIARLVLEQRFENRYAETLRVTYRMPLPADGAVSGYAFTIGDRRVTGVVDKKARARARFEEAIASGRTAALLEQERADIFTQQIGNLPAGEAVVAHITIDQRLTWLPEGEWELRFPTVIGPRYIGAADTAEDVRATHVKVADRPLAVKVQLELAIADAITGGRKASSPTHALAPRADGVLELSPGARLDRDLVVRWPVAAPEVGVALAAARPAAGDADDAGDAFGLLTIVPPAREARATPVARDLIVLLDTSGSMGGGPLDKAKQVVAMVLDSLGAEDRFELIEFSSRPSRYKREPVVATEKAKQDAIRWVRAREASGGTEMRAAVSEALCTLRIGAQRQVIVVTDGYVGGEQQILEALHARLPGSCRLHVLGVGAAVNRSLATALARAGRGVEVLVGIDDDAERGAKRLLDRTRQPMLTNVEITGSALVRHAPEHVPDVFEGAPLVAALALHPDGGELLVRGQVAHGTWERRVRVPARQPGDGDQAICALYAREHVADLEARAMLGDVDAEIEATGLRFQIATRLTSWVAIDQVVRVTGPTRDVLVPQELPYGTRASAFGLRAAGPLFARQATGDDGGGGEAMMSLAASAMDDLDEEFGGLEVEEELAAPGARFELGRDATKKRAAPMVGSRMVGFGGRGRGGPVDEDDEERGRFAREVTPEPQLAEEQAKAEADAPVPAQPAPPAGAPPSPARSTRTGEIPPAGRVNPGAPSLPEAQALKAAPAELASRRKAGPPSRRVQRLLAWYSVLFYLALIALLVWWLLR